MLLLSHVFVALSTYIRTPKTERERIESKYQEPLMTLFFVFFHRVLSLFSEGLTVWDIREHWGETKAKRQIEKWGESGYRLRVILRKIEDDGVTALSGTNSSRVCFFFFVSQ